MAKIIKYKKDYFLDTSSIMHNKKILKSILKKSEIICVGITKAYTSPASNTIVAFDKKISSNGDSLALINNKIKIGPNIDLIKVSANIGFSNTVENQVPILRLCKNDEVFGVFGCTTPTKNSNAWLIVTSFLMPVKEGDLIDLKMHGNSGNITIRDTSYMTVENI